MDGEVNDMDGRVGVGARKGIYRQPSDAGAARRRAVAEGVGDAMRVMGSTVTMVACIALVTAWRVARVALCAVLVMLEPLLRATLVPIAFFSFVVTLVFGFLAQAQGFPKWGCWPSRSERCGPIGRIWR